MSKHAITGAGLIGPLIKAGILPDMMITRVVLIAEPEELVTLTIDVNLPETDAKVLQNAIIAMKTVERMDTE